MQGYITLATGSRIFLEMALNLALSLKLNDAARPICLVTDRDMAIDDAYRPYFDEIRLLDPLPGFHGCLNKLRLGDLSPFDETLYIDSDCILVKNDMDRHWARFRRDGFSIAGSKETSGPWYSFDMADVIRTLKIPYMVHMNSGVFYYTNGSESRRFFDTALELVERHKSLLGTFHRNKLQLADEPFIGAAMGVLGIEPVRYTPQEGSIMITTVRSSGEDFDAIAHRSRIIKHSDFRLLGRFLPRRSVAHSPSIAHFVKLKPKRVYNELSNQLRAHFNLPACSF